MSAIRRQWRNGCLWHREEMACVSRYGGIGEMQYSAFGWRQWPGGNGGASALASQLLAEMLSQ